MNKLIFKIFCRIMCRRGMYMIPPSRVQIENGFARGWGFVLLSAVHSFLLSFLLVSYYKTFIRSLLYLLAVIAHVLTDMLTEPLKQRLNAHIWGYNGLDRFYLYDLRSHQYKCIFTITASPITIQVV